MFSLNLLTVYSMVCTLLPALVYMIVCRRRKGKVSYIWAMVFNLYVWLVYNVTGIGTLGNLFPLSSFLVCGPYRRILTVVLTVIFS